MSDQQFKELMGQLRWIVFWSWVTWLGMWFIAFSFKY